MKVLSILKICIFMAVSASVAIMLEQRPSYAWFKICNGDSSTITVAFGYLDAPDNRQGYGTSNQWFAQGWWQLKPGACTQVYPHELKRRNSVYYYYATANDGSGQWSGDNNFCVSNNKFNLAQTNKINRECGGDIELTRTVWGTNGMGGSPVTEIVSDTYWQGFKRVDTGNNSNYTLTLQ